MHSPNSEFPEIDDELIRQFLESAPLYLEKWYKQRANKRNTLWVREIELHCEKCERSRPFHDMTPRGSGARGSGPHASSAPKDPTTGFIDITFRCVSCNVATKRISFRFHFGDEYLSIVKVGEYPREKIDRDPNLGKFLAADRDLLEKALVSLKNGYGIGAFAYLRQIVENNISSLLDLIQEDVALGGATPDVIAALQELKANSPMSEQIAVANRALPDYLKPGGANPLGRIYGSLSEGVHSLSDEECLKRSSIIVECLKYLISELSDRKIKRDKFASMVGDI